MAVTSTHAALRITHGRLTSKSVTEALGIQPSKAFEIGTPFLRGTRTREHSMWSLDSGLAWDGTELEAHLRSLLDRILPLRAELVALTQQGYDLDWWCFVSEDNGQGGVCLSPALLSDLGQLPVALSLDIYGGDETAP